MMYVKLYCNTKHGDVSYEPRAKGQGSFHAGCLLPHLAILVWQGVPSRELTYPSLGKGKSSSKVTFDGIR